MPKHRLRHQAAQLAAAQAQPQRHQIRREIRGTHRDRRQTLASIDSMAAAEQAAIDQARQEIKNNSALTREDRAAALAQLSQDRVNVAAGADYLARSTRQDFAAQTSDLRNSLVDLSAEQGANAAAALTQLREQAKANRATRAEAVAQQGDDALAAAQKAAQIGRDAAEQVSGMAADAAEADKASLEKARDAARKTLASKGVPLSDDAWNEFQQIVATAEGVNNQTAAQVTEALRKRFLAQFAADQGVNQTLPNTVGAVAQALGSINSGG